MKKITIGSLIVIGLLALVLVGTSLAQEETPEPPAPYGAPWMDPDKFPEGMPEGFVPHRGFHGQGWGGFQNDHTAPLREYMIEAMAELLDKTPEELKTLKEEGKTIYQLAEEEGFDLTKFRDLFFEAKKKAIEKALTDEVISQEQADFMLEKLTLRYESGYGPGSVACDGAGPHFRHPMGRGRNK